VKTAQAVYLEKEKAKPGWKKELQQNGRFCAAP
jgi:hypothetical protein